MGLTGCAAPVERRVERALERQLPQVLGPAQEYRVDVQGLRLSGSMRRITAAGRRVVPAVPRSAPVMDRLEVDLRDVVYSRERRRLERVGAARVRARLTAADIHAFLQAQRGLEVASLELREPDHFLLHARPIGDNAAAAQEGSVKPGAFMAEGRLVPAGPQVNFQVSAVRVLPEQHAADAGALPPPQWSALELSQRLSPLMDVSDLPLMQLAALRLRVMDVGVQQQGQPSGSRGVVVFTAEGNAAAAQGSATP
jgi:hypothetical protein